MRRAVLRIYRGTRWIPLQTADVRITVVGRGSNAEAMVLVVVGVRPGRMASARACSSSGGRGRTPKRTPVVSGTEESKDADVDGTAQSATLRGDAAECKETNGHGHIEARTPKPPRAPTPPAPPETHAEGIRTKRARAAAPRARGRRRADGQALQVLARGAPPPNRRAQRGAPPRAPTGPDAASSATGRRAKPAPRTSEGRPISFGVNGCC